MKKLLLCFLAAALVLTGCSAQVYETISDVVHVSATQPDPTNMALEFPQDAAMLTVSGTDMLYQCGDYTISLQTFASGDLSATVRSLCGFGPDRVTLMQSACRNYTRYDWVWTAAGEGGDVLCRAAVLDDGNYHYCLCVSADAEQAGQLSEAWNALFGSFCLEN